MRIRPARRLILIAMAVLAAALAGFAIWLMRLPMPVAPKPSQISNAETAAMLNSLKPPKRSRPLVAIVGINDATETTDYLLPAGILRRADVADVMLLSTAAGAVKLYPALTVLPDATIAQFDARHPTGADYVVVPAMRRDDDPAVLSWLRDQARKGAIIIGVCAGAKIAGAAGLLDGRRATTHWFYRKDLLERTSSIVFVPDKRFVIDRGIATTTGITASMPMMLTLIEAIGGRAKAEATAHDLGIPAWNASHSTEAFKFTRPFATTLLANRLRFWNRERIGIELKAGVDEASLALVADAWSRTWRSKADTHAPSAPVITRSGIRIIPDERRANADLVVHVNANQKPAVLLDQTLQSLSARYGRRTAEAVAMQLEYPQFRPLD